jgi:hypothetical protein
VCSPINAKEVLGILQCTGLVASMLSQYDPRWERLRSRGDPGVDLRDRFRGALIGGAIGDAMAGRTQARGRVSLLQAAPCSESARLKSNHPLGVSEPGA